MTTTRYLACPECDGSGVIPVGEWNERGCPSCEGTGEGSEILDEVEVDALGTLCDALLKMQGKR